jgi:hypothetical protein
MDPLQPVAAVLITIEPGGDAKAPCRRLPVPPASAVEIAVRIVRISTARCVVAGYKETADELPLAWLKLPGLVAARIRASRTAPDELTCEFIQPLYPADLQLILARRGGGAGPAKHAQPRCTFL